MHLTAEARGPLESAAARWRWPAVALVVASASVVVANWQPLQALVETWTRSPSFEHGYAIVAVTAVLIWVRRHRIAREDPRASTAGVLVATAAAVLGALGAAGAVLVVEQFAFVLFMHGMVLAILGPR